MIDTGRKQSQILLPRLRTKILLPRLCTEVSFLSMTKQCNHSFSGGLNVYKEMIKIGYLTRHQTGGIDGDED